MKKNLLFKKVVALLCCIAMCIPTGLLSVSAVGEDTSSFTVNLGGLVPCDDMGNKLGEYGVSVDGEWQYIYNESEGTITYSIDSIDFVNKECLLLLDCIVAPETKYTGMYFDVVDEGLNEADQAQYWVFAIKPKRSGANKKSIVLTPGEQKYDVTIPASGKDYSVNVNGTRVTSANSTASYADSTVLDVSITLSDANKGKKDISVWSEVKGDITVSEVESVYSFKYTVTANDVISFELDSKTFSVKGIESGDGYTCRATTPVTGIAYGGSCSFYVVPAPGYNAPEVKIGNDKIDPIEGNLYVINNITDNIEVTINKGVENTYSVLIPTGTGYEAELDGANSFKIDEKATFTVTADPGYQIDSVRANGKLVVKDTDGKYSVTVTEDIEVTVTVSKESYKVTYPDENKGYTLIKGLETAEYGSSYSFTVVPDAGYENLVVKVNGGVVKPANGNQYTITIIKETTISIEAGGKTAYPINLIGGGNGTGYTLHVDKDPVEYGGSASVTITVDEKYDATNLVVNVNNIPVTVIKDKDGTYTVEISNVTEAKSVTVSGVTIKTFSVAWTTTGCTINALSGTNVTSGSEFKFTLAFADGYENATVTVDGEAIDSVDGTYTVKDITKDTIITATATLKSFKAIGNPTNAAIKAYDGYDANNIAYNADYKFTVDAKDGYRVVTVAVNGNTLVADDNGVYTVYDVKRELDIVVVTAENELTINYKSNEDKHQPIEAAKTFKYSQLTDANVLANIEGCEVHKFDYWTYNGEKVTSDILQNAIAVGNADITLTAKFKEIDYNAVAKLLVSATQTEESSTTSDGKSRIRFATKFDAEEANGCLAEIAGKVDVYCGTLIVNRGNYTVDNEVLNDQVMAHLSAIGGDVDNVIDTDSDGRKVRMNIYDASETSQKFTLNDLGAPVILRLTVPADKLDQVSAAGWMVLDFGGNHKIVLVSGFVTPQAAS